MINRRSEPDALVFLTALALSFPVSATVVSAEETQEAGDKEQARPLQEIEVTSSRIPLPWRRLPVSVSVLDQAEIEARGNLSLVDVLRQMPSVSASRNGGAGSVTTLRIRGEEGFRTLTLLDGLRLSDPSAVQVSMQPEHLLSAGMERVELLRGPQGLAYGADAGGVINISTVRRAEGQELALNAEGGAYGTRQGSLRALVGNERADLSLQASRLDSDGFNQRVSDQVLQDDDGYRNETVHVRLGLQASDRLRAEVVGRDVQGHTQYDGCFRELVVHDCASDYALSAGRLALHYETEGANHSLAWSDARTKRQDAALGITNFAAQGRLQRLEYLGNLQAFETFDLVLGADWEAAGNNGRDRHNRGFFLEYLSDFSSQLYLNAGLRHDSNDDFGEHTSYRLSGAYLLSPLEAGLLKLKASYGTGFRAPSPYEVEYNQGPFAAAPAADQTLSQETSRGYEVGLEYSAGRLQRLELLWFDQQVEDAIYFDLSSFSGYLQDEGRGSSQGVELSTELALNPSLQLRANFTYNETARPNGEPRIRRPRQMANVGVSWSALAQRLNLHAFWRSSRNAVDEVQGERVDLEDFDVLDFNIRYALNENLEMYARLENALDERYQEVRDYRSPGRAGFVGLRMSLMR